MNNAITWFRSKFSPYQQVMILAALVRLVAAIFSRGFGFHDDHFLIIEASQSWADGFDYNYWLPDKNDPGRVPQGHSLFYVGIHFYLFKFLKIAGLADPQAKMFVVRILHALWSLLIVHYGYKIARQHASEKAAIYTAVFLALFWFMPFISVRNLAEFVCVPAILAGIYLCGKPGSHARDLFFAGIWLGVAFSMRFQSVFVTAGIGVALLLMRSRITAMLAMIFSFSAVVLLTQGLVDHIIWKKPFAEFLAYVQYNLDNATAYGHNNWHMYFDLIFGLLIPPLSIALAAGYVFTWKKLPLLFWPVLLYIAFHTYFPNKQERFILTVIPLIVISGTAGMFSLYEKYKERLSDRLLKNSAVFVIIINLILLPVLSVSYSKRHRVEAMYYLYKKNDSNNFFVEDSNKENDFLMPPLFYYGKWVSVCGITKNYNADSALVKYRQLPAELKPKYFVFWQAENIKARVDSTKKRFPSLRYEATIEPSFIDKVLFWLNPYNDNQTAYIYRLED